ncbi:MAG: DnaJ domain-containing protein [Eubacteriales bacterium]|nr:DnaJ domain-containing protein [Eubacteriales bacterium]
MNPYEVLGVNPNDDEETIKKAYRNLVKKYHPDRYANSPLAEEASEKLKEINLAYDIITGKAKPTDNPKNAYGRGYGSYGGYQGTNFEVSFQSVRMLITMRMTDAAEQMLEKLPKTAEWYYLKGVIYMNRGWYQNAKEHFDTACRMDPTNAEYLNAQQNFTQRTTTYQSFGTRISPLACCAGSLCCSQVCCGGRIWPLFCFC